MTLPNQTIIFDTETTGLLQPAASPLSGQPRIIEFYGVKVDPEFNIIDEFETLIKVPDPLPKKITEITGITDEDLKDKPAFIEIYHELAEFFKGTDRMVAHNLPFDRDMLKHDLMRCDMLLKFPWPMDHYCTIENSNHLRSHRLSLTNLHKIATGEHLANAHRAKVDVMGLVRCYHWLTEQANK